MASTYPRVSPCVQQHASPTIASCNADQYRQRQIELPYSVSASPPVLPARSFSLENPGWDSLVNRTFYVPQTDPGPFNFPSSSSLSSSLSYQLATGEREPPFHRASIISQAIAPSRHRSVQEFSKPKTKTPSKAVNDVRNGDIRIPTGAPLAQHSLSLNSPIKLENQVGNTINDMDAPDLEFYPSTRSQSSESLWDYPPNFPGSASSERYDTLDEDTNHPTPSDEIRWGTKGRSLITNQFDPDLNSQPLKENHLFNLPKRQLSYGQNATSSRHKTLYRSTGSRQLRNQIDSERQQLFPSIQTSDTMGETRIPYAYDISHSRKPRIWIDATKHEEKLDKVHFTALISPPRPQIITIPRRSSSLENRDASPSPLSKSVFTADFMSVTPPETPSKEPQLFAWPEDASYLENTGRASESLLWNGRVPLTPPNSPTQMSMATPFHQQIGIRSSSGSSILVSDRYQPTAWILDELENVVAKFPRVVLRLDSPVIQHLKFHSLHREPRKQDQAPRLAAPHSRYSTRSRYSIFRPLSSHPLKGRLPESAEPNHPPPPSFHPPPPDLSSTNPTLTALQAIFPQASIPMLESLQATYTALHHLLPLYLHPPPPLPNHPNHPLTTTLTPSHIPPKARETLGMPPLPSFPPLPSNNPQASLQARVKTLARGLESMVRDLLGGIQGRGLDGWDEALVRTVGEVVRLGERRGGEGMG